MPRMATDPRPAVRALTVAPETVAAELGEPVAADRPDEGQVADAVVGIASICPYLRMADGSHRVNGSQREHRCWAVEPPSTIPSATQSDLCLVAAHGRCDRFSAAQARRAAGLASDHIPARLVTRPRFALAVDPVPVMVDARAGGREQGPGAPLPVGAPHGRLPMVAAAAGVLIVGGAGVVGLLGGLGNQPVPTPPLAAVTGTAAPTDAAATVPVDRPSPTVAPTPAGSEPGPSADPVVVPQSEPTATPYPVAIARTYLVKEGDTYRALAKRFGVKPRDLRALNGPLKVGERIVIPVAPWVTDAPG